MGLYIMQSSGLGNKLKINFSTSLRKNKLISTFKYNFMHIKLI